MGIGSNLNEWFVRGLRVLAKKENPTELFVANEVDELARLLNERTQGLSKLDWPPFDKPGGLWQTYASYYSSVLADTIKAFAYGKKSNCHTMKYQSDSTATLAEHHPVGKQYSFRVTNINMLERAKSLADKGLHICGCNPMNEQCILGGAFEGAPNFEEDLARISDLGIALIAHARENGDLSYNNGRPRYNRELLQNEALITTNVQVIKGINIPNKKLWYAKQFKELSEKEQIKMSFVGNAAIHLEKRRRFTPEEAHKTKEKIRAHLTAMVKAGVDVALLTDFGCGAYNNDPQEVAQIYKELLFTENYIQFFKAIEFTIINKDNCNVFQKVFDEQLRHTIGDKAVPQTFQNTTSFFQTKTLIDIPEWDPKSTLPKDTYDECKKYVETLVKERSSFLPYPYKGRKLIKALAVCTLIENTNQQKPLAQALQLLKNDTHYQEVIKGMFSTRAADLIAKLGKQLNSAGCVNEVVQENERLQQVGQSPNSIG